MMKRLVAAILALFALIGICGAGTADLDLWLNGSPFPTADTVSFTEGWITVTVGDTVTIGVDNLVADPYNEAVLWWKDFGGSGGAGFLDESGIVVGPAAGDPAGYAFYDYTTEWGTDPGLYIRVANYNSGIQGLQMEIPVTAISEGFFLVEVFDQSTYATSDTIGIEVLPAAPSPLSLTWNSDPNYPNSTPAEVSLAELSEGRLGVYSTDSSYVSPTGGDVWIYLKGIDETWVGEDPCYYLDPAVLAYNPSDLNMIPNKSLAGSYAQGYVFDWTGVQPYEMNCKAYLTAPNPAAQGQWFDNILIRSLQNTAGQSALIQLVEWEAGYAAANVLDTLVVNVVEATADSWTMPLVGKAPDRSTWAITAYPWQDSPTYNDIAGAKWHALYQERMPVDPCEPAFLKKNPLSDPFNLMSYRQGYWGVSDMLAYGPGPDNPSGMEHEIDAYPAIAVHDSRDPRNNFRGHAHDQSDPAPLGSDGKPFPDSPAIIAFEVPENGIYMVNIELEDFPTGVATYNQYWGDVITLDENYVGQSVLADSAVFSNAPSHAGGVQTWTYNDTLQMAAGEMIAFRLFTTDRQDLYINDFTVSRANPQVCGDLGSLLPADLSGPAATPDCQIDFYDLEAYASQFLATGTADFNDDGRVDIVDFALYLAAYWMDCTDPADENCMKPWTW